MPIKTQDKQRFGGSDFWEQNYYYAYFFSQVFSWRIFFCKEKRTDSESEYQIGNPTLGALSYLHVGV